MPNDIPTFKQSFIDWIDDPERGFIAANTWDFERNRMGGPGKVVLFPHQRRILDHVLNYDEDKGAFPYSTVVYSTVKKSGKTLTGAMVGSWFAENAPPRTEIYCLANDLEQASGRVYGDISYHFEMRETAKPLKYKIELENSTFIQALSQSYKSAAGSRHALTLWDELWNYTSEQSRRFWDELQPISTIPYSLRFITTYAGFLTESDLLWDLYTRGVHSDEYNDGQGERIPGLEDLPCYRKGSLFIYWDHDGRMPWQTPEYYERAFEEERGSSYLRLHENRWVTSTETFMPIEWWDEAVENSLYDVLDEDGNVYERKKYEGDGTLWLDHPYRDYPIYVGVDAGIKRDSTAVAGVAYDAKQGKMALVFHKIWNPSAEEQLDLDHTLEPYLRMVSEQFRIAEIAFDPTQVLQLKKRLDDDGFRVYEFSQSGRGMSEAAQLIFDLFHDQNFRTYEADDIREHLQNTIAEQSSTGLRITKDKSTRRKAAKKIDAAIALAMACHRAVENTRVPYEAPQHVSAPFSDLRMPTVDPSQSNLPFALRTDI